VKVSSDVSGRRKTSTDCVVAGEQHTIFTHVTYTSLLLNKLWGRKLKYGILVTNFGWEVENM
jgi:hypothetical protein